MAEALAKLHGGNPRVLHEDFCGSAAVSREWCAGGGRRAVATDLHAPTLAFAEQRAGTRAIRFVRGSVLENPEAVPDADVVFAGNFSVGELGARADLLLYLTRGRQRLVDGGVLVCDVFGAPPTSEKASTRRVVPLGDGRSVEYVWEQRCWRPWSGRVCCAVHFRVLRDGEVLESLPDAFEYSWRVWSVPELIDLMAEAGLRGCAAVDPVTGGEPTVDARAVCVVGRRA